MLVIRRTDILFGASNAVKVRNSRVAARVLLRVRRCRRLGSLNNEVVVFRFIRLGRAS